MATMKFSATRLEGREIDLRRDRLPIIATHPVRDIEDEMDDIIYNAIDVIQERARDNELRTFYFNLMSYDDWRNSDFKKLIAMLGDMIDISMASGKFREVRDAIIPVVEDVVTVHIGYMTDVYPELERYTARGGERRIDGAISTYEKFLDAVDIYRRNGNRVSNDRDDRDDRSRRGGRDRDRGINYGDDERGSRRESTRRDRWDRGAVRDGVHGSRRRSNTENRFGNTDQSDRFDDDVSSTSATTSRSNSGDDRRSRRDSRRDETDDRFSNTTTGDTSRRKDTDLVSVQRLPGSRKDTDVEDALARVEEDNKQMGNTHGVTVANSNNPVLEARKNLDAWLPTKEHPHPLAMNYSQDLFYEMELVGGQVIPHLVKKETIVDYHAHASLSFGDAPRDFRRFEDGGVDKRLDALHEALMKPSEEITPEGSDEAVTVHHSLNLPETTICFSVKEMMSNLAYRRFTAEHKQMAEVAVRPIELATARGYVLDVFMANQEEYDILSELREEKSLTKLCDRLRVASKLIRPELFLLVDQYLTKAVNHMVKQYMSIPMLSISSFTSDWLELFAIIAKQYGDAYRDAMVQNQEREIKLLLNYSPEAESMVSILHPEVPGIRPFVIGVGTKVVYVNEVGYNMNLDMVPGVASALLPETNPFFHDLATDLLAKHNDVARFYIQTADMRVIEASRSYLNDRAVLVRLVQ